MADPNVSLSRHRPVGWPESPPRSGSHFPPIIRTDCRIGPGMTTTRKATSAGVSARGSRPKYLRAAGHAGPESNHRHADFQNARSPPCSNPGRPMSLTFLRSARAQVAKAGIPVHPTMQGLRAQGGICRKRRPPREGLSCLLTRTARCRPRQRHAGFHRALYGRASPTLPRSRGQSAPAGWSWLNGRAPRAIGSSRFFRR
jgi:hypothetical protein